MFCTSVTRPISDLKKKKFLRFRWGTCFSYNLTNIATAFPTPISTVQFPTTVHEHKTVNLQPQPDNFVSIDIAIFCFIMEDITNSN